MAKYSVEVQQLVVATVDVGAATPEEAIKIVDRRDFELPPLEERQVIKGAGYVVFDEAGNEVLDRS